LGIVDADVQSSIDGLNDPSVSENEKSSCLDVLEVLLDTDALPALKEFAADPAQPASLRQQATNAVRVIQG
jgi:hypothetical protein